MKISATTYLTLAIALAVITFSPFHSVVLNDVYAAGTETESTETEGAETTSTESESAETEEGTETKSTEDGEVKKKVEGEEEEPDC